MKTTIYNHQINHDDLPLKPPFIIFMFPSVNQTWRAGNSIPLHQKGILSQLLSITIPIIYLFTLYKSQGFPNLLHCKSLKKYNYYSNFTFRISFIINPEVTIPICHNIYIYIIWFVVWNMAFIFPQYMGCHPSQLTNSIIFQDGHIAPATSYSPYYPLSNGQITMLSM